jgi:hypothetical protein
MTLSAHDTRRLPLGAHDLASVEAPQRSVEASRARRPAS